MKNSFTSNFFFQFSFFFLIIFFFDGLLFSQTANCYRITFTDKVDSPYSIEQPEEFLSPRALAKRARFDIAITEQDLPVNQDYINQILDFVTTQKRVIQVSKWNNSIVMMFHEASSPATIINQIESNFEFVKVTLPVAYLQFTAKNENPNQDYFNESILFNPKHEYNYGNSIENLQIHKGQLLHKEGFCGEEMLICVFDAGWSNFNSISHFQPLYQNGQIWGVRDMIPGSNNIYVGHSHGTSVTSTMATTFEGTLVGTAPKANYYFIRSENPWSEQLVEEDWWAQACEIADSLGADVINSSLGYTTFDYYWQDIYTPAHNDGISSIASRAATLLAHRGVIVCNSAGNEGNDDWHYLGRPSDAKDILAVGAVDKDGNVASFTSYGPSADGRVKPDIASVGWNTWVMYDNGYVGQGNGTSFASPVVAGLSACLWQAMPQKSSLELMQLIREYGDKFANPNNRVGYGIPNFYQLYLDHYRDNINENNKSHFAVYPNPTSGELRITNYDFLEINKIEIYDVTGRQLSIINYQLSIIDISNFVNGVYFIKIYSNNKTEIYKIIKK